MRLPNLKEIVLVAAVMLAAALPMKSESAPIPSFDISQAGGNSIAYVTTENPDFTYDSAQIRFDDIFKPVAEAVQANNSDYVNKSVNEIMDEWNVQVSGSSEVLNGWSADLNNGFLDLTHSGRSYDIWNETSDNSAQDSLTFLVDFGSQLDFNHNGQYDAAIEQLVQSGALIEDAVTGYNDLSQGISSDTNALNVVPEPATMGLLSIGSSIAFSIHLLRRKHALA